jgi:hypothetical protein
MILYKKRKKTENQTKIPTHYAISCNKNQKKFNHATRNDFEF